jgi:hypothetical protein
MYLLETETFPANYPLQTLGIPAADEVGDYTV